MLFGSRYDRANRTAFRPNLSILLFPTFFQETRWMLYYTNGTLCWFSIQFLPMSNIFTKIPEIYIYIYIPSLHVDDRIRFSFSLNFEKIIISYLIERFNWKLFFIRTKFNKIKIHSIKSFSICLHEFLASCLHNISKHLI